MYLNSFFSLIECCQVQPEDPVDFVVNIPNDSLIFHLNVFVFFRRSISLKIIPKCNRVFLLLLLPLQIKLSPKEKYHTHTRADCSIKENP